MTDAHDALSDERLARLEQLAAIAEPVLPEVSGGIVALVAEVRRLRAAVQTAAVVLVQSELRITGRTRERFWRCDYAVKEAVALLKAVQPARVKKRCAGCGGLLYDAWFQTRGVETCSLACEHKALATLDGTP